MGLLSFCCFLHQTIFLIKGNSIAENIIIIILESFCIFFIPDLV